MKTIPAELLAHYGSGETRVSHALEIRRSDGNIYGFTSASQDLPADVWLLGFGISTPMFESSIGLDVTGVRTTNSLAVDNMELNTFNDGTVFTKNDILSGRWSNAYFRLYRYCWSNPEWGYEVLLTGSLGEVKVKDSKVSVELRGLQQKLQQALGCVTTKNCRARLGDALCTVSDTVTVAPLATITSISVPKLEFYVADVSDSMVYPADWFGEGTIRFIDGPSAGLKAKVLFFAGGGVFQLISPMMLGFFVGNTIEMKAGCRKQLTDCSGKFNNVLNFQGEPHVPGIDKQSRPK